MNLIQVEVTIKVNSSKQPENRYIHATSSQPLIINMTNNKVVLQTDDISDGSTVRHFCACKENSATWDILNLKAP